MKVINFLKEHGTDKLASELNIIVKESNGLIMLNYNQIDSPKMHPIVQECRSLIMVKL